MMQLLSPLLVLCKNYADVVLRNTVESAKFPTFSFTTNCFLSTAEKPTNPPFCFCKKPEHDFLFFCAACF